MSSCLTSGWTIHVRCLRCGSSSRDTPRLPSIDRWRSFYVETFANEAGRAKAVSSATQVSSPRHTIALSSLVDGFNALTDLLQSFPLLQNSHFIFVPGPLDPWSSSTLPRPALPAAFTARLAARIPKAKFVSNPCRIRYFGQEIVVYREDLMGRMVRGLVSIKNEEAADMKRYVSGRLTRRLTTACADHTRSIASVSVATIDPTDAVGV